MTSADKRPLRPGDVVEVRSAAEILATLDSDAALDRMPFMPEMVPHIGRRYRVTRRVDKICDTIAATGSRRMHATVYLEDLRCDGSGHGGCQAGCKLYWKEAWLRRVDDGSGAVDASNGGAAKLEHLAQAGTRTVREVGGDRSEVWRCQATEAFNASDAPEDVQSSTVLARTDERQFWSAPFHRPCGPWVHHGDCKPCRPAQAAPVARPGKPVHSRQSRSTSSPATSCRCDPQARSRPRLTKDGQNRGLSFDREMLPYCGRTFRVKDRVRRIIDDKTGRMLNIPKDCLILDGVVCSGERSAGRWFCPRQIYPYWREAWLRRVEQSGPHLNLRDGSFASRLSVASIRCRASESSQAGHADRLFDPEAAKSPFATAQLRLRKVR